MKLCIGIPGDLESMNSILASLLEKPYEVYFSIHNNQLGSSRFGTHNPDREEFKKMIQVLKKQEINPNIVLNTVCFGNQQFSKEFQHCLDLYLKQLSDEEVNTITVADPFLIKHILQQYPEFKIVVSSTTDVKTQNNVLYYNNLGVDRIIVSPDINRELSRLKSFIGMSNTSMELLVNEGCLLHCPWKQSHHKYNAHKTRKDSNIGEEVQKYIDVCGKICLEDQSQIVKSPFIRPEDICVYEEIGVEFFKVAGRNLSPEWITKVTRAYQEREYEGNVVDLLNSKEFLSHRINIPNKDIKIL